MAETFYPSLREVLDPRYADLADAQLEGAFAAAFGEDVTPAEYEEFFNQLGRALNTAAPVLASIGQGALSGAAAGGALGGPWGALGGAITGGVGSALAGHTTGPARDVGRVITGVVGTAGSLTSRQAPAGGPSAVPAAGHLQALLADPRIMSALALLLQRGGGTVPVGAARTPVEASEVAGLVGALALEAAAEAHAGEAVPAYLLDTAGQLVVDPADPAQRAGRLLQLFGTEGAEGTEGADTDWGDVWDDADSADEVWQEL
ncbi:hypothetical protein [Nonomuraea endophytica]|uniref:Uncharacterized protein n=1 Tax=Nonomuraea endophytica TaxID=714136 RepID=A0A7W8EEG1_9ACTN|nr:hypothetical protein [Nonomuraea endophytica]MBB5076373.1 hypothetical protein [Nonomuraea endophytica]